MKALELADYCESLAREIDHSHFTHDLIAAAAELRRLAAVEAERDALKTELEDAKQAAKTWENEAERRSDRYIKCAADQESHQGEQDMTTQEAQTRVPAINQPWPEQGGIYIGSRLVDGKVHHVVIPGGVEFDHVDVSFDQVEKVVNEGGELHGFSDWRAPDQEDLMLAYINAREHFVQKGIDSIYWSRSEHHDRPWAVDFEYGNTFSGRPFVECRVRPFRLITLED